MIYFIFIGYHPPNHHQKKKKKLFITIGNSTKSLACVRKNNHTKTALIFEPVTPCAWYLVLDLRHVDIFCV